jgi:hypothetical protein
LRWLGKTLAFAFSHASVNIKDAKGYHLLPPDTTNLPDSHR